VIFSFTFAGLGATDNVIALPDAGNADWTTATADPPRQIIKLATRTTGNCNRQKNNLGFISYLRKGI
jgi:hypothetical protein